MKRTPFITLVIVVSALVACTVLFAQSDSSSVKRTDNNYTYSDYLIVEASSIPSLISKLDKLKDYKLAGGVAVSVEKTMHGVEFKTFYQSVYR